MKSRVSAASPRETVLKDGTRVGFRPIRPDDKRWLIEGIARMSPESRYRRFFAPMEHLTEDQLRYFTEVDGVDHAAWVATLPGEAEEPVIAVARYIRTPEQPDSAEAAVTVIDAYQGRGIGRALLQVLTEAAIDNGVRRFVLLVLGENERMINLLHEAGAVTDRIHEGVCEMHVDLPASVAELDTSAAPRVLRVAASGELQGEVRPGLFGTRFLSGKHWPPR